jgi:hypothetical protein
MRIRRLKCLLSALVLALLLVGHGSGSEWRTPPEGQPDQMRSRVDYDPKLTHPFFTSNKWSYSDYDLQKAQGDEKFKPPRLKHTAECLSNSFRDEHEVRFCEARLIDTNMIDLFINDSSPAFDDYLLLRVRNGMFTSQFWTYYRDRHTGVLTWTTKRQKLTLDKKSYQKGDMIKGKIYVEISDELNDPKYPNRPPRPIRVEGVFKTIVK